MLLVPPIYAHYQWRDEFLPIAESNVPSYKVEYPGRFLVTIRDNVGCVYDSDIMRVSEDEVFLGKHIFLGTIIKLYPNPIQDLITFNALPTGSELRMFDIMGQKIYSFIAQSHKVIVAINHLPRRVYLVQICNTEGVFYTTKVVKD